MAIRVFREQGLTLVEVAVMLVIVGILISIGVSLIGPLTKRAKQIESRNILKEVKEAIVGYTIKNGYLPTNLNQAGVRTQDAWLRDIVYVPASGLTSSNQDVCVYSGPYVTLNVCKDSSCTTVETKSDVLFLVYSRGEDGDGGCTDTGSGYYLREQGFPYTLPCTYNPSNPAFNYDDILEYVPVYEVISRRCVYSVFSISDLCSGGSCVSACNVTFKNNSASTVWVKGGSISCQSVGPGGQISLGSVNAQQVIYVYTSSACSNPVSILKLASAIKSPSTINWVSPGSATCN